MKGGTPQENAEIVRAVLGGERGPKRNAVLLNAGAALYIGGRAEGLEQGVALAAEIIDAGKALKTLQEFVRISNAPEVQA